MAISNERFNELLDIYAKLKTRILLIDEKYSLEYVEPQLDMPDSLYLTKLSYEPKSEEELHALAEQNVAALILAKQASLDAGYNTKINNLNNKTNKAMLSAHEKVDSAERDMDKAYKDIRTRLANNGLIFSTLSAKFEEDARKDLVARVAQIKKEMDNAISLINQEQEDVEKVYRERCQDLQEEKETRVNQKYLTLVEDEEKLKRSIEKYNTGLDEKEAKYQASRARTYELARRAAHNRAIQNSKLYMEMGEIGYRRVIEQEKYLVCQDVFYPLRREEGQTLLNVDSFLVAHLGSYYSSFVDWVNLVLTP